MTAKENAHRYRVHHIDVVREGVTLAQLAEQFPPPAPEPREILTRIVTEHSNG